MKWRSKKAKGTKPGFYLIHQEKFLSLLMKGDEDACWRIDVGRNIDPLERYCTFTYKHPNSDGYRTFIGRKVSYEIFVGEIEEGKVIKTTCGKLGCVNPKHLAVVSRSELGINSREEL